MDIYGPIPGKGGWLFVWCGLRRWCLPAAAGGVVGGSRCMHAQHVRVRLPTRVYALRRCASGEWILGGAGRSVAQGGTADPPCMHVSMSCDDNVSSGVRLRVSIPLRRLSLPDSELCTRVQAVVDPGTDMHVRQIRFFFVHRYLLHWTLVRTTAFVYSAVIHHIVLELLHMSTSDHKVYVAGH